MWYVTKWSLVLPFPAINYNNKKSVTNKGWGMDRELKTFSSHQAEGSEWVKSFTTHWYDQFLQGAEGKMSKNPKSDWKSYFIDVQHVWCLSQLYISHFSASRILSLGLRVNQLTSIQGVLPVQRGTHVLIKYRSGDVAVESLSLPLAIPVVKGKAFLGGLLCHEPKEALLRPATKATIVSLNLIDGKREAHT